MRTDCETIAVKILPTIRALIAKELIDKYGMTQQQAAKKLGITQSAISQYTRQLRGSGMSKIEKNKEIIKGVERVANKLASQDSAGPKDLQIYFCSICKTMKKREIKL